MFLSQSLHINDEEAHTISVIADHTAATETYTRREYHTLEIKIDQFEVTFFLTPAQLVELQAKIANPAQREL